MPTLLVAKPDFAAYADLPESLDLARLTPHILAAQRTRLRPVLTTPLFDELLLLVGDEQAAAGTAPPDPLTGAWAMLREKALPVVCCAAPARYMPFAPTTPTATRVKSGQYSEAADGRDLARMAGIYEGDALSFEPELRTWLATNAGRFASFYPQATSGGAQGRAHAQRGGAGPRPGGELPLFLNSPLMLTARLLQAPAPFFNILLSAGLAVVVGVVGWLLNRAISCFDASAKDTKEAGGALTKLARAGRYSR